MTPHAILTATIIPPDSTTLTRNRPPRGHHRTVRAVLLATLMGPSLAFAQESAAPAAPAAPPPLLANAISGPYIGLGAGLNLSQRSDLTPDSPLRIGMINNGISPLGRVVFSPGFAGVLSGGWGFGNGLRLEVEGTWRSDSVDRFANFNGIGGRYVQNGGRRDTYGIMGNVMLDLGTFGPVVPYVGIGAGYVVSDWSGGRGTGVTGLRVLVGGDDGRFAYQGIAGFAFPMGFAPGLSVTAEYRFLGTVGPNVNARVETPAGVTIANGRVETESYQHSLMLGLRYAFGQSGPRAAPPAAAPAPARSFLVFFDFNRDDLTERARQIIADAAQAARAQPETRIEVAGHADRSGTPQYNQALSQRRAESVAAELVRRGVARTDITVTAFGESRPLVPTADGAREPQNRRVEIVLR